MSHPHQIPDQSADERTDDRRVEAARRYVQQLQAFYVHASVFAGAVVIMFLVNLVINLAAGITGEWSSWWSAWAVIGWGLGITVHGLVVRLNRPTVSSSTWEQRQIDKVLSK